MKNKLSYIFFCVLTSFVFINNVFAEELDFTVNANVVGGSTTVVKGTEVSINVSLNSDVYLSACTFKVTEDSGIESISKKGMNNYHIEVGDRILIDRDNDDTNFTSNYVVMQLKYKVNDSGKVTIKNLDCAAPATNQSGTYSEDVVVEFQAIDNSEDTSLKNIVVTGGTLSPSFSSSRNDYSIQLSGTKFSLSMTASNSDYQDDIVVTDEDGNTLDPSNITFKNTNNQGSMRITIKVNNDTTYNLLAVYEEEKLYNSLKSLIVDGKTVNLQDGKYDYTVTIGNNVDSVKIDAVLTDSTNFKFTDEFNGTQIVQTPSNSTSYPIIIEPSSSDVGAKGVTYTIKLIKEGTDVGTDNNQNTTTNPTTGGISMIVMMIVLMASLIGSIVIYQKNLKGFTE